MTEFSKQTQLRFEKNEICMVLVVVGRAANESASPSCLRAVRDSGRCELGRARVSCKLACL